MMISQMRNVRAALCAAGLSVCALVAADECNFRADSAKNGLKRELRILSNKKHYRIGKVLTFRNLSNKFAISGYPYLIAVTSARIPRFVLSTSQPARHKCLTKLICPCRAATCNAVRPCLFGISRSIPLSINRVVIPSSPASQAICKRVSSLWIIIMCYHFISALSFDINKINKRFLTESFTFNGAPCNSNWETASTQPRFTALIIAPPRPWGASDSCA